MPTKRRRLLRSRILPLSTYAIEFLRTGVIPDRTDEHGWFDVFLKSGRSAEGFRQDWADIREDFLEDWTDENPGRRPWAWWRFDAPLATDMPAWIVGTFLAREYREPRRRLGGIGTPAHEALACAPHFHFGIPVNWVTRWDVEYHNGHAQDIHGKPIGTNYRDGHFPYQAIDPNDPPRFESEAADLDRHGLLTADEGQRLESDDFLPESVEAPAEDFGTEQALFGATAFPYRPQTS